MILIEHARGAPGLRLFGLGASFMPVKGLNQLKKLFDRNAFWAQNRSKKTLRIMLSNSDVVTSIWIDQNLVAFGRATTDGILRSTIWDVVVEKKYQDLGLGSILIESILKNTKISCSEKIYLMTTNCENFYKSVNFENEKKQTLMIFKKH